MWTRDNQGPGGGHPRGGRRVFEDSCGAETRTGEVGPARETFVLCIQPRSVLRTMGRIGLFYFFATQVIMEVIVQIYKKKLSFT